MSKLSARMDVPGEFYTEKHLGDPKIPPSTILGVRWRRKIRFFDEKISVFRPRHVDSMIMITAGTGEKLLGIGAFRYWKPPLN